MEPKLIFYSNSQLLEGPRFDLEHNLLYFVSILDYLVYCYNPETQEILSINLKSPASCVFVIDFKIILVATKNGFYEVNFNSLSSKKKFQIDIPENVRYNDGIEDPKGRIIIGTMGFPEVKENVGKVFSYYQGSNKTLIDHTTISNGLAFSLDQKFLYFIDTPTKKVARYFYDIDTGVAKFDTYVIEFKAEGAPDGMCMDDEGMLWIAEWNGGCVSNWNPINGHKIQERKLPCPNVTSCCLDNFGNLYVTTAKSDSEIDVYGGGLFYIELNNN
jgi:sugar lactone lactonase YvrE